PAGYAAQPAGLRRAARHMWEHAMHNHHSLSSSIQIGLGVFYLLGVIMNLGFASYQNSQKNRSQGRLWMFVACVFLFHSLAYFFQAGWVLPDSVKNAVNAAMNPVSYFVLALLGLSLVLYFRNFFTDPVIAWGIL